MVSRTSTHRNFQQQNQFGQHALSLARAGEAIVLLVDEIQKDQAQVVGRGVIPSDIVNSNEKTKDAALVGGYVCPPSFRGIARDAISSTMLSPATLPTSLSEMCGRCSTTMSSESQGYHADATRAR